MSGASGLGLSVSGIRPQYSPQIAHTKQYRYAVTLARNPCKKGQLNRATSGLTARAAGGILLARRASAGTATVPLASPRRGRHILPDPVRVKKLLKLLVKPEGPVVFGLIVDVSARRLDHRLVYREEPKSRLPGE